jgi:hypothetical protein
MYTQHEKSTGCRAKIYKFGNKRRQCSECKKTWTVWPKKRGVKLSRPRRNLLKKVLVEKQSLFSAKLNRMVLSEAARSLRLRQSMEHFVNNTAPNRPPAGELILLIDALWFRFKKERWAMYLRADRSVNGDRATFLDPVLLKGRENHEDWSQIVDSIPPRVKNRVVAMVSDGFRGSSRIAKSHNWIFQRCHFHLFSQLQVNRGRWKKLPNLKLREQICGTMRKILATKTHLPEYLNELIQLLNRPNCPRRLHAIGIELIRHHQEFRSYLNFPHFNLLNTTNSVESMNKIIRTGCRHLRTPESLILRSNCLIRLRKTIACKPKIFQQN